MYLYIDVYSSIYTYIYIYTPTFIYRDIHTHTFMDTHETCRFATAISLRPSEHAAFAAFLVGQLHARLQKHPIYKYLYIYQYIPTSIYICTYINIDVGSFKVGLWG